MKPFDLILAAILQVAMAFSPASGSELVPLHSFRVPALKGVSYRQFTFNYSRGPVAFRAETNTLVLVGHANYNDAINLTIPEREGEIAETVGDWFDPTAGLIARETAATGKQFFITGLVITADDQTFGCISQWYNTAGVNRCPFFRGDLTLGGYSGPWNGGQHSLALGEYLAPLSPDLRRYFGVRMGGAATISQGSAQSRHGPALYVFDMPNRDFIANGVFQSRPVITSDYPGWYPSWRLNCIAFLPDEVIWAGAKGEGRSWYGETPYTFPDGYVANDGKPSSSKGYHSETYRPTLWRCTNASIKAGSPTITETGLSSRFTTGQGAELNMTYDPLGKRLYFVDPKSDGDRPVIRVYGVK